MMNLTTKKSGFVMRVCVPTLMVLAAGAAFAQKVHVEFNESVDFCRFKTYGWLESTHPGVLRLGVRTDPHSPGRWRVNGVVQNMPEFREAFGCKPGQPMAPANACRVW